MEPNYSLLVEYGGNGADRRPTTLQVGDRIWWSARSQALCFSRQRDEHSEPDMRCRLIWPNGDDKWLCPWITDAAGFWDTANLIAATHGFSLLVVPDMPIPTFEFRAGNESETA